MVFNKRASVRSETDKDISLTLFDHNLHEILQVCEDETVDYINALIKLKLYDTYPLFKAAKELEQIRIKMYKKFLPNKVASILSLLDYKSIIDGSDLLFKKKRRFFKSMSALTMTEPIVRSFDSNVESQSS